MPIIVDAGNGIEIEFPDGTSEAEIKRAMAMATGTAPPAAQAPMGGLEAFGRGAAQGVTLGFGDEIYAGAGGLYDAVRTAFQGAGSGGELTEEQAAQNRQNVLNALTDGYSGRVGGVRDENRRAAETNPLAYYGGEIAGAVALPMGGARVAARLPQAVQSAGRVAGFGQVAANARAGLGARALAGAREGAAYGALYGFGSGEGDAQNRLINAGQTAAVAAPFGAVVPAAVDAAAAAGRQIGTIAQAATQPKATARAKMAEALLRDSVDDGVLRGNASANALNVVEGNLERMQASGKPAVLADVGGENTRNLVRSAANMPSASANRFNRFLDKRQLRQWKRVTADVDAALAGGDDAGEVLDTYMAARSREASFWFDKAYSQPWRVSADSDLAKFLQRPYMTRIVEKTTENVEGMSGEAVSTMRPWEVMHRVKMQIDREIGALKRGQADSKASWDLRDLTQLKRQFVRLLGRENRQFRTALRAYADDSSLINALEDGKDEVLKLPIRELRKKMQGLSTEERRLYRLGASQAVKDTLLRGNRTRDRIGGQLSSPDIRQRLAVIAPDRETYGKLLRNLEAESRMVRTRGAVQGNSTTAKQLAQADEAGQAVRPVVSAAQATLGRFEPLMNQIGRLGQRFSGITPAVADEIINQAMQRDPAAVRRAFEMAMTRAENAPIDRAAIAQNLIAAGVVAGNE